MFSTDAGGHALSLLRVTLVARASLLDFLGLAAVPAVPLAVFALPEATRRSLAFAYQDPTTLTTLSAHYLHFDADHLLANLAGVWSDLWSNWWPGNANNVADFGVDQA